ncbi:MAG: hypothetical protein ACOCZ8_02490 [Bacteroidota bacterium]
MNKLLLLPIVVFVLALAGCGDTCYDCQTVLDATGEVVHTEQICDQDEPTAINLKQDYEYDRNTGDSTATCLVSDD